MLGKKKDISKTPSEYVPIDEQARINQLKSKAYDALDERLSNGSATASEIIYILSLDTEREQLQSEVLSSKAKLMKAQVTNLEAQSNSERIYAEALEAMASYRPSND